jgi:hypothetical protein
VPDRSIRISSWPPDLLISCKPSVSASSLLASFDHGLEAQHILADLGFGVSAKHARDRGADSA